MYAALVTTDPPFSAIDRIRSAGVIVGPAAFISAWFVSGARTEGYSPTRDHISDLAAIGAPTRTRMNIGFTAFAVAVGLAASPLRRHIGTPAAAVLGANALLSIGIMLASLGQSEQGDRIHSVVAGLGYLALAARCFGTPGLDPASEPARRAIERVRGLRWEEWDNLPYFAGEVEPCINGGILALAAYFGEIGAGSDRLVDRLLGEQLEDGGWNCWAPENSRVSSFHSTINVLEGFLEYERTVGPAPAVAAARQRGEEYLLERRLFRSLRTGQVINPDWSQFSFPTRWYYDVLRGLEYLRAALPAPDERCAEAIELVLQKRQPDGRWLLESPHPGDEHFDMDPGAGQPSRWITLRALRVLRWSGRVGDSRQRGTGSADSATLGPCASPMDPIRWSRYCRRRRRRSSRCTAPTARRSPRRSGSASTTGGSRS